MVRIYEYIELIRAAIIEYKYMASIVPKSTTNTNERWQHIK
jgi:hypothetical protein